MPTKYISLLSEKSSYAPFKPLHFEKWNHICFLEVTFYLNRVNWRWNAISRMCLVILSSHPSHLESRCDLVIQRRHTHAALRWLIGWPLSMIKVIFRILFFYSTTSKHSRWFMKGNKRCFFDYKLHHYHGHERQYMEILL